MGDDWDSIKDPSKIHDIWSISKDKATNERGVALSLLNCLSLDSSTLISAGTNDPPDCLVKFYGVNLGIEVIALIDKGVRDENAKARRENRPVYYAQWTKETFREALANLVTRKDGLICSAKHDGKAAAYCDLFWLAIHTDEFSLNSAVVGDYLSGWTLDSEVFERIFLILSYEPGREGKGHPCFELK